MFSGFPSPDGPLGILGGTFDPVHFGHLRLAEEALDVLGLDQVLWIPAGRPPHRGQPQASPDDRLTMVRRALDGQPRFVLDEHEVTCTAPSYTVMTLERLRAGPLAKRPLVLLLGADAFAGLTSWHRWRELLELAHIGVASRQGVDATMLPDELSELLGQRQAPAVALARQPAGRIVQFPMTPLGISASGIRALLRAGRSARYLLPELVLDYIARHRLYPTD
ncbi:MAG TPA: nicotinate-nucleotide adenylyltransferase [Rhodocyclaceae bacterium]|nr:nicotinate-nucleotide adenylyltransferase [Rhodocyclaceae bacterium]